MGIFLPFSLPCTYFPQQNFFFLHFLFPVFLLLLCSVVRFFPPFSARREDGGDGIRKSEKSLVSSVTTWNLVTTHPFSPTSNNPIFFLPRNFRPKKALSRLLVPFKKICISRESFQRYFAHLVFPRCKSTFSLLFTAEHGSGPVRPRLRRPPLRCFQVKKAT